jgi:hypothetical protein
MRAFGSDGAYEAARAVACGRLAKWGVTFSPSLTGGTYYVMLLSGSAAGAPADGSNQTAAGGGRLIAGRCFPVVHVGGAADGFTVDESTPNATYFSMLDAAAGVTLYVSSTAPTSVTGIGSNALFSALGE